MSPFRGWNTWNALGIDQLSDDAIQDNARIIASRLLPYGYTFVNIDDGFFYDRDDEGNILVHPEKFPNGMKYCLNSVKEHGLKTGIYSDAGRNTCGFYHNQDPYGRGCGLENHEERDLSMYLTSWDCDLIKIDWCGGWLRMNQKTRYTELSNIIKRIKPSSLFCVCSWGWPGEWVIDIADSWRVSQDLQPTFRSIVSAINKTKDLWKYSSDTKFNDLDIMQLGNGLNEQEERTHFSMWCMLNSPILLSCDLPKASNDLFDLVTNKHLLAIHDDILGRQAIRSEHDKDCSVWKRVLSDGRTATAVINHSNHIIQKRIMRDSRSREIINVWDSKISQVDKSFTAIIQPKDTSVFVDTFALRNGMLV